MSSCSSLLPRASMLAFSKPSTSDKPPSALRLRASADIPDFLSADWLESRRKRPFGPRLEFSAEEAVKQQLDALKYNDQPRPDYGIEVMYRFAGFDPFERSTYFGPFFDLGQFERFRRIFHHSTYRVLLGHKDRKILSRLCGGESVQATNLDTRNTSRGGGDFPVHRDTEGWRILGWILAYREPPARWGYIFWWSCVLSE